MSYGHQQRVSPGTGYPTHNQQQQQQQQQQNGRGIPTFPDFFREVADRERELGSLAASFADPRRFQHPQHPQQQHQPQHPHLHQPQQHPHQQQHRSHSNSPTEHRTFQYQPAVAYSSQGNAYETASQASYSPQGTPPYAPSSQASAVSAHQGSFGPFSNDGSQYGNYDYSSAPSPGPIPAMIDTSANAATGSSYYHDRVFTYPAGGSQPQLQPAADASTLVPRPMVAATSAAWGSHLPAGGDDSDDGGAKQRKKYTKKPVHNRPPPPSTNAHQDEPYMREAFSLSPDMDLTLGSLRDPVFGDRPNYPLPLLAALAIHGSPQRRLTLQEIFKAIEERFEWFAKNKDTKSWKNSVRHLLSLHKIFRQEPRPITEPGKGHYWKLDFSEGVGNKRERKRRPKGTPAPTASTSSTRSNSKNKDANDDDEEEEDASDSEASTPEPTDVVTPQRKSAIGRASASKPKPRPTRSSARRSASASNSTHTNPGGSTSTRSNSVLSSISAATDDPVDVDTLLGDAAGSARVNSPRSDMFTDSPHGSHRSLSHPLSQGGSVHSLHGSQASHGSQGSGSGSSHGGSVHGSPPMLASGMPAVMFDPSMQMEGQVYDEQPTQHQFGQGSMGFGSAPTTFGGFGGWPQ